MRGPFHFLFEGPSQGQSKQRAQPKASKETELCRESGVLLQRSPDASVFTISTPPPLLCVRRFKRYISSHGASIQKTKLFLERESSRLVERQAALRMAQSGSSLVADQEGAPAEDVLRSLQQVRDGGRRENASDSAKSQRADSFAVLSLFAAGGRDADGAAADGPEGKLPAAEAGGAAAGAHQLSCRGARRKRQSPKRLLEEIKGLKGISKFEMRRWCGQGFLI